MVPCRYQVVSTFLKKKYIYKNKIKEKKEKKGKKESKKLEEEKKKQLYMNRWKIVDFDYDYIYRGFAAAFFFVLS